MNNLYDILQLLGIDREDGKKRQILVKDDKYYEVIGHNKEKKEVTLHELLPQGDLGKSFTIPNTEISSYEIPLCEETCKTHA